MSKCKSCGATIIWIPTESGKNIPCDPKPIPYKEDSSGSLTLVTNDGRVIRARMDITSDALGYVSHFATCPDAKSWRRNK